MKHLLLALTLLFLAPQEAHCASCRSSYCYTSSMCGSHCACIKHGKSPKGLCYDLGRFGSHER